MGRAAWQRQTGVSEDLEEEAGDLEEEAEELEEDLDGGLQAEPRAIGGPRSEMAGLSVSQHGAARRRSNGRQTSTEPPPGWTWHCLGMVWTKSDYLSPTLWASELGLKWSWYVHRLLGWT